MKKVVFFGLSRPLATVVGLCVLASVGVAYAEPGRQGFYAGVEVGVANPADIDLLDSFVNHPTQCDQVLRATDPTNLVDLSHPDCNVGNTPGAPSRNSFDLDAGFLGGFSLGYALNNFRVEFEYMNRSHGGNTSPWRSPGGNQALASKGSEWSTIDPPSERISDFSANQFFVNAYYDFLNPSRWTPYLGAGVGWASTSLDYGNRFLRKTIAQGYPSDKPPAAAGTVSILETEVSEDLFGFQLLGGLDYALTEKVSLGMKGRWAQFEDISHNTTWTLIRSHAPVRADGRTPFTSAMVFDDIEYWALSVGLKYYF